jgi:hypothetical protein
LFVTGISHKNVIFNELMMIILVFIKQIFRAVELAPPSPSPSQGCAGGGIVYGSFQSETVILIMALKQ